MIPLFSTSIPLLFSSSFSPILFARKKKPDPISKEDKLLAALNSIKSEYGEGAVMKLVSNDHQGPLFTPETILPTGSLSLDIALGTGGLPKGRIIEIYGPESSGKTTLALSIVAQAQKGGGKCVFIDAEHALDPRYAKNLGVDTDNLYVCQPDYGEQALEIVDTLIRSGAPAAVVVDSVASLVPRAELEADMESNSIGLQARMMSQALRKITGSVHKTNTILIFINQLRSKIGTMFGNPETTPGGRALRYHSSVRLDIRKIGQIKQGDKVIGDNTRVKVAKNKLSPPFGIAQFEMMYGTGISRMGELLDLGAQADLVQKSGSWFSYKDIPLGQGREKAKKYLSDHPEIAEELETLISEKINPSLMITGTEDPLNSSESDLESDQAEPEDGASQTASK